MQNELAEFVGSHCWDVERVRVISPRLKLSIARLDGGTRWRYCIELEVNDLSRTTLSAVVTFSRAELISVGSGRLARHIRLRVLAAKHNLYKQRAAILQQ